MTNQKRKRIYYRDRRPYLLADYTKFIAENKENVRTTKFRYFDGLILIFDTKISKQRVCWFCWFYLFYWFYVFYFIYFVYFILFVYFVYIFYCLILCGIFVEQNIDGYTKSVWVSAWKSSFTECVGTSTWSWGFPNETGQWWRAFFTLFFWLLFFDRFSFEALIVNDGCSLLLSQLSYYLTLLF